MGTVNEHYISNRLAVLLSELSMRDLTRLKELLEKDRTNAVLCNFLQSLLTLRSLEGTSKQIERGSVSPSVIKKQDFAVTPETLLAIFSDQELFSSNKEIIEFLKRTMKWRLAGGRLEKRGKREITENVMRRFRRMDSPAFEKARAQLAQGLQQRSDEKGGYGRLFDYLTGK